MKKLITILGVLFCLCQSLLFCESIIIDSNTFANRQVLAYPGYLCVRLELKEDERFAYKEIYKKDADYSVTILDIKNPTESRQMIFFKNGTWETIVYKSKETILEV